MITVTGDDISLVPRVRGLSLFLLVESALSVLRRKRLIYCQRGRECVACLPSAFANC